MHTRVPRLATLCLAISTSPIWVLASTCQDWAWHCPLTPRMHTGDKKQVAPALAEAQAQLVLWDKAVKDEQAQVAWEVGWGVCAGRNDSQEVSLHLSEGSPIPGEAPHRRGMRQRRKAVEF